MSYGQSLNMSFPDRFGWFFTSLSGDLNTLMHSRNAQPLARTLSGMRKFVTENHPSKLAETEELITSIEVMVSKLEAALDA